MSLREPEAVGRPSLISRAVRISSGADWPDPLRRPSGLRSASCRRNQRQKPDPIKIRPGSDRDGTRESSYRRRSQKNRPEPTPCPETGLEPRHGRRRRQARAACFERERALWAGPTTTPRRSPVAKKISRAMRWPAREHRTSQSPSPNGRHNGIPIGHPNCTVARSAPITRRSSADRLRSQSKTGSVPVDVR